MTWDGVGMACKMDERMDGELYCQILDDEHQGTLSYYHKPQPMSSSNREMTQSTPAKGQNLVQWPWIHSHGMALSIPRPQPNRTSVESCQKRSLGSMKSLPVVFMSCGIGFRRSGRR